MDGRELLRDPQHAVALAHDLFHLGLLDDATRVLLGVNSRAAEDTRARIDHERSLLADLSSFVSAGTIEPIPRRVLHVVAEKSPADLLAIDRAWSLDPVVVTSPGVGAAVEYRRDVVDGVVHFRLPGAGDEALSLRDRVRAYAQRLATVVRTSRPSALHVRHDRWGTLIAAEVAAAMSVPTIVELDDHTALDSLTTSTGARVAALVGKGAHAGHVGAVRYVEALERAGVLSPGVAVVDALAPSEEDKALLIEHLLSLDDEGARLESSAWSSTTGNPADVASEGWSWRGLPPIRLEPPLDWYSTAAGHRSQASSLHAWDFMGPALRDYAGTGDLARLNWCAALAVDWCRAFDTDPVLSAHADDTMAWYDMSLARRAPRLAFLLQEVVRRGADRDTVDTLYRAVIHHQRAFVLDRSFAVHSNHGFYTAVGQLAFTRRLFTLRGMNELHRQGTERFRLVAERQFATDGGHREHSPYYHRMLVDSFSEAIEAGLVSDPEVLRRVESALDVLGWFVQPDGRLVQIGDSSAKKMRTSNTVKRSPHAEWVASNGQKGARPEVELRALPESGYGIVRAIDDAEPSASGYLTLMAGFHSRTHKHADDLSLTWFDKGAQILCDAGRFGYLDLLPKDSPDRAKGFFYSGRERQYVESTRAHSTVEVDGQDHERRARTPYGSALGECHVVDGHFCLNGHVDHGLWRHHRSVRYRPGRWLYVQDDLIVEDDAEHTYRAWWHLDGELQLNSVEADAVCFTSPKFGPLWITTWAASTWDGPVRGQAEPLRGWRSMVDYQLVPSWSLASVAHGPGGHRFRTLLSLGAERPLAPPSVAN